MQLIVMLSFFTRLQYDHSELTFTVPWQNLALLRSSPNKLDLCFQSVVVDVFVSP